MKLNSRKCKVMPFDNKKLWSEYSIDALFILERINFDVSDFERDLEVFLYHQFLNGVNTLQT